MTKDESVFSVNSDILEKLIFSHDGDMALLFLFKLKYPDASSDDAAGALCRTLNEIACAEEKLNRIMSCAVISPTSISQSHVTAQIVPESHSELTLPEDIPQYTAEEITRRGNSDSIFQSLISEAKRITGGFLSESFTRTLFGIYDYLRLPPEVIFMLLNYCSEITSGRNNKRRLSSRDLEQEAYRWYNNGAVTLESAEEYLSQQREHRNILGRLKAILNITGRQFTKSEREYIDTWLEMGFDENAIAMAYDRTVTNVGSLKWPYMNKILLSWDEKKLHTAEAIEAGDSHFKPAQSSGTGFTANELEALLGKLKEEQNGI